MSGVLVHMVWLLLGAAVISFVFAPMESLGWWAGWLGPREDDLAAEATPEGADGAEAEQDAAWVVYVSGIGSISGTELLPAETDFLDRLQRDLPGVRIVRDVFPYAPSGRPLMTGQRAFAWFWRHVQRWRVSGTHLLPAVLNLRNLFQVLVSADRRYGPLYSFAIAGAVMERLRAAGHRPGTAPVVLLGVSGGAQISVGAATYLAAALGEAPALVSVGGVMAADRGLDALGHTTSLYGTRDRVYRLGRTIFPGRWKAAVGSPWNVAIRDGRLEERHIGTMGHSGRGGYLDRDGGPGESHMETTVRAVAEAVRGAIPAAGDARAGPGGAT